MVAALRELIELVLTEVAISGTDGTGLGEIWELIKTFNTGKSPVADNDVSTSDFCLDRALREDLWEWLTLNSEVSVGQNKEYNGLTLSEAEEIDSESKKIRVFVSEHRTWKALTGHEKDESKVPATEFALLSIIASCRSQGILQTELVRRSGQDPRSVPKRTDALNNKGYIEKRQVQAKSAKTSLCVFSRFATVVDADIEVKEINSGQPKDVIDIDSFCQGIFRVLKQHQIISRNDLKAELGFNDSWRRRVLSRTIRKFETIGCVQRVKARSQFHENMKALHPCILLVREPSGADMKLFKSDSKTLFSALDQENEDLEEQAEVQSAEHVLIKWSPDVNVPNLIASLIEKSGTTGRTNAEVIREGFGRIFRRPSENTLNRMTEGWQLSQPSHLRRSAIVRDTALNGTVTHYVHYSYSHFKELVNTARADWEAVTFRARDARSSKLVVPPPDAPPAIDNDGLAPLKQLKRGIAERDIYCTILSKGLVNYAVSKSDPIAIIDHGGNVVAVFEREVAHLPAALSTARNKENDNVTRSEPMQIEKSSGPCPIPIDESVRNSQLSKAEKIEAELKRGDRPAKEVFAAYGLDESWTHVAVRLMERKTAGVYITTKGKARPAGKRQGRPKESQIVVFKSPSLTEYLKSLPQPPSDAPSNMISHRTPTLGSMELPVHVPEDTLGMGPTNSLAEAVREPTPVEQRTRLHQVDTQPVVVPLTEIPTATTHPPAVSTAKIVDENTILREVPDATSSRPEDKSAPIMDSQIAISESAKFESDTHLPKPQAVPVQAGVGAVNNQSPSKRAVALESASQVAFTKSRRLDREGSVARLRRNIIMNIVEKAGGAFPAGSELWHAFSTVWMKHLNHPEKPDSRTIKTVVKYLIDAGKLRQMTFSGKGPKGLMITRSIVMRPDISSSDALVIKMRQELLNSNYYVPDNVEVDASIAKLVRGSTGAPTGVYSKPLPVESAITVNLRNKPAFLIAREKRKEETLHRRLLKPIRLMGIKRKGTMQATEGITSFSRPVAPKPLINRPQAAEPKEVHIENLAPMDIDTPKPRPQKRRAHQTSDRATSEVKRRKRKHPESNYAQFINNLEDVSQWEMTNLLSSNAERASSSFANDAQNDMSFIHHTVHEAFESAPIDGSIRFAGDGPSKKPQASYTTLRARRRDKDPVSLDSKPKPRKSQAFPRIIVSKDSESRLLDSVPQSEASEQTSKPTTWKRRRRGLKDMPVSMIERLKYAIIVVRTIAGGSQGKSVDWDLVVKAFPDEDPELIRVNGKLLLNRDRRQLAQMQDEFRVKFLTEYRKDDSAVPSIDFNNMAFYDWDAVVTWAATQYYTPSARDVPILPGKRARLKQNIERRVDQSFDEFEMIYTPNPPISISKRATIFSSRPYLQILESDGDHDQDPRNDREAAKCWILSNVVAPEETYDAADARRKLSRFPDSLIEDSIKELIRDRFLAQVNRGRVVPGRNYAFTELFHQTLGRKRAIDVDIIKQASKFKRVLDDDFKRDGVSQIKYDASDGDVLAIMALAAERRVHIFPNDPPANPFGLTEGNYETRALDKAIFKFQLDVIPDSERYEYGNPVSTRLSQNPSPISDEELKSLFSNETGEHIYGKPPLWLDINGNIHEQLWEMIVSAIVGLLAIRPKLDSFSIHEQLQKYVAPWDVERILNWLAKVGLVEKEDGGRGKSVWAVREYWWLVWD